MTKIKKTIITLFLALSTTLASFSVPAYASKAVLEWNEELNGWEISIYEYDDDDDYLIDPTYNVQEVPIVDDITIPLFEH